MGMPPQGPPPAPPKQSGGMLKWLLGGCGCLLLLGICGGGGAWYTISAVAGTEHIRSAPLTAGQPFAFTFNTGSAEEHAMWIDYDVTHTVPWQIGGTVTVLGPNGQPLKNVQLTVGGSGATTTEGGARMDLGSTSSSVNGNGSASGMTRLFTIPAQPSGTTLTVQGQLLPAAGTTINKAQLVIRR